MRALSSMPLCPCDGRQAGLWYLPARWRDTTLFADRHVGAAQHIGQGDGNRRQATGLGEEMPKLHRTRTVTWGWLRWGKYVDTVCCHCNNPDGRAIGVSWCEMTGWATIILPEGWPAFQNPYLRSS